MLSPVSSIINKVFKSDKHLNVLTAPTHERYETGLAQTGHTFWAYRAEGIKDWNNDYGACPENYILLEPNHIPDYINFDLVLSQNKFGQFQALYPISRSLHIPLVSLEHTLPFPGWSQEQIQRLGQMRGDINVFISEYSVGKWNWQTNNDTAVIHHMVDSDVFNPGEQYMSIPPYNQRENHILSVVNDWIGRDWCCNYSGWKRITEGLKTRVVGDTKGLSVPAPSINALVREYRESAIFLNTSTISPVPTALLEAMACGCAVVSTATCMIPEIIENGVNGFLSNDESELRGYLDKLLADKHLQRKVGYEAAKTIKQKFSKKDFLSKWTHIFEAANSAVIIS